MSHTTRLILEVVFKVPLVIFGLVMIIIGALSLPQEGIPNGCQTADRLPVYVLFGGCLLVGCIAIRTVLERLCSSCAACTNEQDCCKVGGKILEFTTLIIYDLVLAALATIYSLVGLVYILNNVPNSPFYRIEEGLGGIGESIKESVKNVSGQEPVKEGAVFDCNLHLYNTSIVAIFMGFLVAILDLVFLVCGRLCFDIYCCAPCAEEDKSNGSIHSIHSEKHREVKCPDERMATRAM